jgi:hypothetical protein
MRKRKLFGLFACRERGGAMVEFILMLPIIVMVCGLGVYLAIGLRTKAGLMVKTRYDVWRSAARLREGASWWWHDDMHDWTWSKYDPMANGPPGSGAGNDQARPRGTGDALDYLYTNAGQKAESVTANIGAMDLFNRVWNNLPGMYDKKETKEYDTQAPLWKYLNGTIHAEQELDTAAWTHGQVPLWVIAQYGPMLGINNSFHQNLNDVPQSFRRMRDEVYHAWFEEDYMMSWNDPNAKIP